MQTLDRINRRMGSGTLRLGAEGFVQDWRMRRRRMSPGDTTRWSELPLASRAISIGSPATRTYPPVESVLLADRPYRCNEALQYTVGHFDESLREAVRSVIAAIREMLDNHLF